MPMIRPAVYGSFFVATILFIACGPHIDKKRILGSWKGVAWEIDGQSSAYDAASASFTFRDDKSYTYSYAGAEESGTYYIVNQELYTTPAGGVKMMVKIRTLTQDSLVFDMNRGGMAERLTLLRE